MKKEVLFSQVKRGQQFQYGIKVGDKWEGITTYKKRSKDTANPACGQEHQIYGFTADKIVLVEA